MTAVFGDDDPEDAYDVSDPLEVRAALLGGVALSIVAERALTGPTLRVLVRLQVLRRIAARLIADLEA